MQKIKLAVLLALVLASLAAAQVRDSLPVPDVPGYRTLKADLHLHTVFSDGEVWPTTRVTEAWRDGLDVIALTDHTEYHPHEKDLKVDAARPHAIAQVLAGQLGIILIPGVETAQGDLHCNALFVTDPNALRGSDLRDVLRRARAQDAFVFWNHPGWKQTPEWFPVIAAAYGEKLIQGMEIVNGSSFYPEAYPWIEEKSLAILANSDGHGLLTTRHRPITLVFAKTADAAGVREALFARRTAAWMGGEVWGAEQYLTGLWQGAVKLENPELASRAGMRAGLRLRNQSAIPFKIRVQKAPEWLQARGVEVRAEATGGLQMQIARTAPAGINAAELELEITNFHIGPHRNLIVRLPVRIEIGQ